MKSVHEAAMPVADVLKTAGGNSVKAYRLDTSGELPPISKDLVLVALTPPDQTASDGMVKFSSPNKSLTFSPQNLEKQQIKLNGVYKITNDGDPILLVNSGSIGQSSYGILCQIAEIVTGAVKPTEQDLKDTLEVVKKIYSTEPFSSIARKNKNFSYFFASLQSNTINPEKTLGKGTHVEPRQVDAQLIDGLKKAAKATLG